MLRLARCACVLLLFGEVSAQPVIDTFALGGPNNLPAAASGIGFSLGIAADPAGNVYFSSVPGHRIYKVDTSGVIRVVAGIGFAKFDGLGGFGGDGGPATAATLNVPFAPALDGLGNLYFSDTANHRIRKVSLGSGIITTVAGNGTQGFSGDSGLATAARMDSPTYVAADGAGSVFFVDSKNHRVRWIAPNGFISTVAGAGTPTTSGNGGPAFQAGMTPTGIALDGLGNLYIGDSSTDVIRKVVLITNIITTIAGNGNRGYSGDGGPALQASFNTTTGLVAQGGKLYVGDGSNQRIRVISNGTVTTIAGNGTQSYSGDGGPASAATIDSPTGVAIDGLGRIYFCDAANLRVRRIASGIIETVAGNGSVGYGGDGVQARTAASAAPGAIAINSSFLYFTDVDDTVRRVSLGTGELSLVAGIPGVAGFSGDGGLAVNARLNNVVGVALDNAGNVYVSDENNNRIRRISLSTGVISTFAGNGFAGYTGDGGQATNASINKPSGLAIDNSGNLYVVQKANNVVRRIVLGTGIISTYAGNGLAGSTGDGGLAFAARLNSPGSVGVDGAGHLFIADVGNGVVRRVDAVSKIITTVAGSIGGGGKKRGPSSSANQNALAAPISDDGGPATSAVFSSGFAVNADVAGNIFIVDGLSNRIRRVDRITRIINTVAGNGTEGSSGGDGGPATSATISLPAGIAIDATGTFYFSDALNYRIRRVGTRNAGSNYSRDYVQKSYVAYYGRPADPAGQDYWALRMDSEGQSLNAIIGAFGNSDEFNRRYGGLSFTALVTRIYQQALGRDPDPAGLAFYVGELQAGRRTLQSITLDVLNGATTAPDATVVANKLQVAAYFTVRVAAGCAYGTEQIGVDSISGVTALSASVTTAKASIDSRCGP